MSETPVQAGAPAFSAAAPRDYFDLLKPRVMSLVVFTALAGMIAAPGPLDPTLAAVSILAIAVGAGASGALNMWFDADIDAVMARTARRPVPAGRVPAAEAATLGAALSAFSVVTLAFAANYLAAALLAFTIFFYVVIYTMGLKRRTPQNIVIGGAAGALPPVIGWAAATGTAPLEPWLLFLVIFLWTPPHFWAMSLFTKNDYAAAGVPMLPVVAGEPATRRQIWLYSLVLAPVGLSPVAFGFAGWIYGAVAALAGAQLLRLAWIVRRTEGVEVKAPAKKLFAFSIFYLFALFGALLIEHAVGLHG